MSKTLELPEPVFTALEEAAAASGTTPAGWVEAHLPAVEEASVGAKTLGDLFKGRVGRIRSGGREALSEKGREFFEEHLERKRREGHL